MSKTVTIRDYVIKEKLGKGTYGVVYRVEKKGIILFNIHQM